MFIIPHKIVNGFAKLRKNFLKVRVDWCNMSKMHSDDDLKDRKRLICMYMFNRFLYLFQNISKMLSLWVLL